MLEKPRVALRLVEALGERIVHMEQQLEDVAFKPIATRLASLLLEMAAESGSNEVAGYTHQDFAEMLGTYRETVTQTLKELKLQGLVEIGRNRLVLVNLSGLRQVAEL